VVPLLRMPRVRALMDIPHMIIMGVLILFLTDFLGLLMKEGPILILRLPHIRSILLRCNTLPMEDDIPRM
jgi:hypothetical protein